MTNDFYVFLLAFGVVEWLAFAFFFARSRMSSIYHPGLYYLFFQGFIFVFRPVCGYIIGYTKIYDLYQFYPSWSVKETVLMAADLGFACFMITVMKFGHAPLVLRPSRFTADDVQRRYRKALIPTAMLLLPIGIAAQIYAIRTTAQGYDTMIRDTVTGFAVNTDTNGYFTQSADFLGALTVLLAWQFRFKLLAVLPFACFFATRVASGGGRWSFLLTSAAFCLFVLYDHRRKWPTFKTMVAGATVLAVFAVVGEQRDILLTYLQGRTPEQDIFQDRFLEGMDFGNMEYFEYLVSVIPDKTHTWGYFLDNLQLFTEPIPRILWPGKPIGPPIQLWSLFDYGTPIGMTYSLPGEGWVQLGYLGVAIWCSLAGFAMGKLYNMFAKSRQSGFQVGIFLLLLPMTVQAFRDGSLVSAFKFALFFLITVLVWRGIAKVMRPPRQVSRGHLARVIPSARPVATALPGEPAP